MPSDSYRPLEKILSFPPTPTPTLMAAYLAPERCAESLHRKVPAFREEKKGRRNEGGKHRFERQRVDPVIHRLPFGGHLGRASGGSAWEIRDADIGLRLISIHQVRERQDALGRIWFGGQNIGSRHA
ncbi:hypothetical protein CH63R_05313 [Colletotrichum higginsianum IMI 349063]|uniref:Uncharacterized protein n=1 Tax=Colletotrichum higginsianum (strain IMI 349063) TaxID=759273 RepID=A0A1B7YLV4_COLHI|nr:hypothetical protein CH63R_05313 [Colletotrichum higginsianum IMI 349063]OBR13017.1 hypothetical protein CH63R_05313 [Colletotrichum higginsianum IMI 349063]